MKFSLPIKKHLSPLLLITTASLLYTLPVLYSVRHLFFRRDSDYTMLIGFYDYISRMLWNYHTLPRFLPLASGGMPVLGEMFHFIFYLPASLPVILTGFETGFRVSIVLTNILAGMCMYTFLHQIQLKKSLSMWGAILYMYSGIFAARVAAGHIFTISFALWPLVFTSLFMKPGSKKAILSIAGVSVFMFFSGDVYGCIFITILYATNRCVYIVQQQGSHMQRIARIGKETIAILGIAIAFAFPKLWFVLQDSFGHTRRFFQPGGFAEGSIHPILSLIPYINPFRYTFYDRPTIQRLLGFHFNWYEYYAFISPLPFLFLIKLKTIDIKKHSVFLAYIVVGIMYVAQAYPFSPFYWILQLSPLTILRVPQRMFMPMTSIVIALIVIAAQRWNTGRYKTIGIAVLLVTLLWTYREGHQSIALGFEAERTAEHHLAQRVADQVEKGEQVVTLVCCIQSYLIERDVRVLNYYSGTVPNTTPNFLREDNTFDMNRMLEYHPPYVIAPRDRDLSVHNYRQVFLEDAGALWKAEK